MKFNGTPRHPADQAFAAYEQELEALCCKMAARITYLFGELNLGTLYFADPFTLDGTGHEDAQMGEGLDCSDRVYVLADGFNKYDDTPAIRDLNELRPHALLTIISVLETGAYTYR